MNCRLLACIALSVLCAGSWAQQNVTTHQHPQPEMIDGKDHPELIPDLTAYRLYLLAVARPSTPTEDEKASQAALLKPIHLSNQEHQAFIPVLASFRQRYMKLIEDFNKQAEAAEARGQTIDPAPMFHERDLLVQSTHDTLKSLLTPGGWTLLDNHIQGQKHMMKIPAGEGLK